jgi:hypothetical protein
MFSHDLHRAVDNCAICGHDWVIEHALREANNRLDVCASQLWSLHQLHGCVGDEVMRDSLHKAGSSSPIIATALEVLRLRKQWPRLSFGGACCIKRLASFGFSEEQAMAAWLAEAPDELKAYERLMATQAARAGAPPVVPTSPSAPWPANAAGAAQIKTKTFRASNYLAAYDRIPAPTHAYMLLEKVHKLCRLFAALKDGSDSKSAAIEADAFFDRLQCGLDSKRGHLGDVGKVATRIWSSEAILKLDRGEYEFCHALNEVLRRDQAGEMLDCAVLIARGINLHCVQGSYVGWPCGPAATGNRRSDVANTTFRGGGIRKDLIGWFQKGKKYRTGMFVASSFRREVADKFEFRPGASSDKEPVLWVFHFLELNCIHVNFLRPGDETSLNELEFLLPPGSVLTVIETTRSDDVKLAPHKIAVLVAPDNALEPLDLPVAPWS